MPKRLYISDLDGTLLTPEATLSEFTRQTLERLIKQGMLFTIATSRSAASVQHIFQGMSLPLPIIEVNGAYISDLATGQHEYVSNIDSSFLSIILQLGEQQKCSPLVSSYDGQRDHLSNIGVSNDGMQWYADECKAHRDPRWRSQPNFTQTFQEQVVRFTFIERRDRIMALNQSLQNSLPLTTHLFENPYHPNWYWLTVQSTRTSKAEAIKALQRNHGLTDHEVVVFGDQDNDLEMFEAADRPIAVANAIDPLKAIATTIIAPHDQDSVAQYLITDWENSFTSPNSPTSPNSLT